MRTGREVDDNGHLVLFPSKACETFRGATNPADVIAGLQACVDGILELPDEALSLRDKAWYRTLRDAIPPFTYGTEKGKRVILPAASWTEYGNAELPMLGAPGTRGRRQDRSGGAGQGRLGPCRGAVDPRCWNVHRSTVFCWENRSNRTPPDPPSDLYV